jgi:RNA polymerase sigma-70 factor (ECF subfamily)
MKSDDEATSWFKDIFDRNYEYIRNYLYYLSGDMNLAEDIAQDVFMILWEKRSGIRDETVRPLLFTIARNCFLKNKRHENYDLRFRSAYFEKFDNKSPEYLLELKEFDEKLQQTIANLPGKCRPVFLMNRIDGMTYREIAEYTGVSVKAVEKQMRKALAFLRNELDIEI